ncbi:hypothetical protein [Micromonospora carbonacea]|uniref:hypothetical protein n=1 Tax=Micromonospora carbonacea TaxID=47853 RepID=UPI00371EB146
MVAVERHSRPCGGTVTAVDTIGGDTVIEVDVVGGDRYCCGPNDVTVVPIPAAGQRWRCLTDPNLVLVVESASGPLADCRTSAGLPVGNVILPGWYELLGGDL